MKDDSNAMEIEGKGRASECTAEPRQQTNSESRSKSPQDEFRDVIMSTPPSIQVVQFNADIPEQEPLPEPCVSSPPSHTLGSSGKVETANPEEPDECSWVVNFLEGITTTELEEAAKLSTEALRQRYPRLNTLRRLESLKFALAGFISGFSRGYDTSQARIHQLSAPTGGGAAGATKTTLNIISPRNLSIEGKSSLSPLTPVSITSISPSSPNPSAFLTSSAQKAESVNFRGERANFVVPPVPATSRDAEPEPTKGQKAEESTRPPSRAANEADGPTEPFHCTIDKCNKHFTKRSEFKYVSLIPDVIAFCDRLFRPNSAMGNPSRPIFDIHS
ncbi:hypothetical protein ABW19_dt0201153 [Dactylella cylindrospora]|nr:hypothetical protein ABW19_dt0201153 [Dactylella cylindrospora]